MQQKKLPKENLEYTVGYETVLTMYDFYLFVEYFTIPIFLARTVLARFQVVVLFSIKRNKIFAQRRTLNHGL